MPSKPSEHIRVHGNVPLHGIEIRQIIGCIEEVLVAHGFESIAITRSFVVKSDVLLRFTQCW